VDYLSQFVIPFHGLKAGRHHYEYEIDNEFFEHFEYAEVKEGRFRVDIHLEKQERMLELEFGIEGQVKLVCDRCAGEYMQRVNGSNRLIVKFGPEQQEISDEILVIPESKHQLNISAYIYEYIILHLPYKRVHPPGENGDSTCDPEMIRLLEGRTKRTSTDPRWDELKKIKF
jgi:uncharacterized metal-binding protein YceD (DUF177 family)